MRISVFTTIPPGIYSGGRYLSLILAHALARAGAQVSYICDNAPLFEREFARFSGVAPVRAIVAPEFALPDDLQSDWVIVVPTGGFNARFYDAAIGHARSQQARIALLSFETPNWFAEGAVYPRSPMPTESWRQVIAGGGLVVTIAQEGVAPAQRYFGAGRPTHPVRYAHWHPPINDLAADTIRTRAGARRRVVMFVRTEDRHKGAYDLLRLPPRVLDGHVLSLVFGRGVAADYVAAVQRHFAPAQDFAVDVLSRISDEEKFALLAEARLLLFPSYFEGYGYPPVEAAWMGVPSVAYDLPVLREVAGEAVWCAPKGDTDAFAALIARSLAERPPGPAIRDLMQVAADTLSAGQRFVELLDAAAPDVPPIGAPQPDIALDGLLPRSNGPAASIAARKVGDLQLWAPEASIAAGIVTVRGRTTGLTAPAQVRIGLPDAPPITADVVPAPGGAAEFAVEGRILRWPDLLRRADLPVSLMIAPDDCVELGTLPLRPDAAAVLCEGADGGTPLPGDMLVIADAAMIAGRPRLAAALGDAVALAHRHGMGATLLCPTATARALSVDHLDLLPRFTALGTPDPETLRSRVAQALGFGRPVLLEPRWRAAAGLDEAVHLRLELGDGEALLAVASGLAEERTHLIPPGAGGRGRRALAPHRQPAIVVLPSRPVDDLPPAVASLLRQIRMHSSGLQVLLPRSLLTADAGLALGRLAGVVAADPEALHAVLDGQRDVAGLLTDPALSPPPEAALLKIYDRPLLRLADGVGGWQASLRQTFRPSGPLAAALAPLFPTESTAIRPDRRPMRAPVPTPPASPLPVVPLDDVLSLAASASVGTGGVSAALLQGWKRVSARGSELAADAAVLGFRLRDGAPVPDHLELLLELRSRPHPDFRIEVQLNDHNLGSIQGLRAGIATYRVATTPRAWWPTDGDGQQTLHLRLVSPGQDAEAPPAVMLLALSPRQAEPPLPKLAAIAAQARALAPRFSPAPAPAEPRQSMRFHQAAAPGFLRLLSGWSVPEAGHVWSDGLHAALGFAPPLLPEAPVLLTLEAFGFSPAGQQRPMRQRMTVRHGDQLIAEAIVHPGPSAVMLPLTRALGPEGIGHLQLDLPDALSPHSAGLSGDRRRLGIGLTAAHTRTATRLETRAALEAMASRQTWRLPIGIGSGPGVLRLVGTGPAPLDARFLIGGEGAIHAPHPLPEGGWEALVPIDTDRVPVPRLALLCSRPNPGTPLRLERLEVWSSAPAGTIGKQAELVFIDGLPVQDDLRTFVEEVALAEAARWVQAPMALPATYEFRGSAARAELLGRGWSRPEEQGTWTDGASAVVQLPQPSPAAVVTLNAATFLSAGRPMQRMRVDAGSRPLASLALRHGGFDRLHLVVPEACAPVARLVLHIPDAASPKELGLSIDARQLGLCLRSLGLGGLEGGAPRPAPLSGPGAQGLTATISDTGDRSAPGVLLIRLTGREAPPLGIAHTLTNGNVVMAHAHPVSDGWQALLALDPGQLDPQGRCHLRRVPHEADLSQGAASDLFTLQTHRKG